MSDTTGEPQTSIVGPINTFQNTWTFTCIEGGHDRCGGTTAGGNACTCPCHQHANASTMRGDDGG